MLIKLFEWPSFELFPVACLCTQKGTPRKSKHLVQPKCNFVLSKNKYLYTKNYNNYTINKYDNQMIMITNNY